MNLCTETPAETVPDMKDIWSFIETVTLWPADLLSVASDSLSLVSHLQRGVEHHQLGAGGDDVVALVALHEAHVDVSLRLLRRCRDRRQASVGWSEVSISNHTVMAAPIQLSPVQISKYSRAGVPSVSPWNSTSVHLHHFLLSHEKLSFRLLY